MSINYERVNWDTTSYVNPHNMNQMDEGIESACNGVDNLSAEVDELATSIDERIGDMSTLPHPDDDLSSNITAINSTLDDLTEITSGTAIKASGVSGTAEYVKIGKTVTAKISIRLSSTIPADTVLVSKLPKNTISAWSPCVSKIDGTTYIGIIDNEGNFKGWSNYPINTDLVACVTYLTSE